MQNELTKLDNEQKKAVYFPFDESVIILAPPGSGKTLAMAKRIEHLIKNDYVSSPFKILGLTFTNAAANEMKNRVINEVPDAKKMVYITTFHSFAYLILRAYGNHNGILRNFSVIGEIERENILLNIFCKYKTEFEYISIKPLMERRKALSKNETWNKYDKWKIEKILKYNEEYVDTDYEMLFEEVLNDFRDELNELNSLDYDHILYYAYNLLKTNQSILNYYRAAFKYVLVDEFQDTNIIQFKILSLIVSDFEESSIYSPPSIFILADPDQGIYAFQGANHENIKLAKDQFECNEIKFKGDYRFDSNGIKLLKELISLFIDNQKIDIDFELKDEEKPRLIHFENRVDESKHIFNIIKELKDENIPLHEIAILAPTKFRLKFIKKIVEKDGAKYGIDYICVPDFRGVSIEERYHVLFESLNNANKTKGQLSIYFKEICKKEGLSLEEDVILKLLWKISKKYDNNQFKSKTIWEKNQLFNNELLLEINWGELLRKEVKNKIFFSTVHGAKGLEFEHVIFCGLEQDSIPHWKSCKKCNGRGLDLDEWIENLKLVHVGTSRAKSQLYLTNSFKNEYGYKKHTTCLLKPFEQIFKVN